MRKKDISCTFVHLLLVIQLLNPAIVYAVAEEFSVPQDSPTELPPTTQFSEHQPALPPIESHNSPAGELEAPASPGLEQQPDTSTTLDSQTGNTPTEIAEITEETTPLAIGDGFTIAEIPYYILSLPTNETPGTVQIGDGNRIRLAPRDTLTIPPIVTFSDDKFTITTIAANAFTYLKANTISIPETVHTIGRRAFARTTLTAITIPDSVIELGDGALLNNEMLQHVTLPNTLKRLPDNLLANSSSLEQIQIPASVETIGDKAFYSMTNLTTVTIPSSVTTIGPSAFALNKSLATISLPEDSQLKFIGQDAFYFSGELQHINLPASIETIGENAFGYARKLESVGDLSLSALNSLGKEAFYQTSIRTIALPHTLTEIGNGVFSNTETFEAISIDPQNPNFTSIDGVLYDKAQTRIITYPIAKKTDTFTVPSTVLTIDDYTFQKNKFLSQITLPEGVTTIGQAAFQEASKLTQLYIPQSVTTIGRLAIANMPSLTEVTIAGKLDYLGYNVIFNNPVLNKITLSESITEIGYQGIAQNEQLKELHINGPALDLNSSSFGWINDYENVQVTVVNNTVKEQLIEIGFKAEQIVIRDDTTEQLGQVVVHYHDTRSNPLIDPTIIEGQVGSAYQTEPKLIPHYEVIVESLNTTGVFTDEPINVTYTYRPIIEPIDETGEVTVRYVTKDDTDLAPEETLFGIIGEDYLTTAKEFAGYSLTETPDNASGQFQEDPLLVTYVYQKDEAIPLPIEQGQVTVLYIDKEQKELAKPDTLAGEIGEDYMTKAKEINGYALTETPKNATGKYQKEPITVTYIYEKTDAKAEPTTDDADGSGTSSKVTTTASGKGKQSLPKTGEVASTISHLLLWAVIAQIAILWHLKKRDSLQ